MTAPAGFEAVAGSKFEAVAESEIVAGVGTAS